MELLWAQRGSVLPRARELSGLFLYNIGDTGKYMLERKYAQIAAHPTSPSSRPLGCISRALGLEWISATSHRATREHHIQLAPLIAGQKLLNALQLQCLSIVISVRETHVLLADYLVVLALHPFYHVHARRALLREHSLITKKPFGLPAEVRLS